MSCMNCSKCGFPYEVVNYQPCPTCKILEAAAEKEEEEPEYFYDGEETFKMKKVA